MLPSQIPPPELGWPQWCGPDPPFRTQGHSSGSPAREGPQLNPFLEPALGGRGCLVQAPPTPAGLVRHRAALSSEGHPNTSAPRFPRRRRGVRRASATISQLKLSNGPIPPSSLPPLLVAPEGSKNSAAGKSLLSLFAGGRPEDTYPEGESGSSGPQPEF